MTSIDAAVSLVIPGRNASATVRQCLDAVVPLLGRGVEEIIFVDDGSTDDTARIVGEYPVRLIRGDGRGPGAARNLGWRAARGELVWFIDSDCVAQPDALERLMAHFSDPKVGGVGGSYGNMRPDSLLACLIHEEIIARHRSMTGAVTHLGSYNVVYPIRILKELHGFDEHRFNGPGKPGAEDADLAYRVHEAGYTLRFAFESRVGHFHPTSLRRYLRSQCIHGYWRVNLHRHHPRTGTGDTYSSIIDHLQPPLAMLALASLPLLAFGPTRWGPAIPFGLLALAQIPITAHLVRRAGQARYLLFAVMSFLRAFWRGVGMTMGVLDALRGGLRP